MDIYADIRVYLYFWYAHAYMQSWLKKEGTQKMYSDRLKKKTNILVLMDYNI